MDTSICKLILVGGILLLAAGVCPEAGWLQAQEQEVASVQKDSQQSTNNETQKEEVPVPLELSPATVFLVLNINPHVVDSEMRLQLSNEVRRRLQNAFGQSIDLKLSIDHKRYDAPVIAPDVSPSPNRLVELNQSVIELFLDNDGEQWQIRAKSWLSLTDQWIESPPRILKNPQAIALYMAKTVSRLVPCVVRIKEVELQSVTGLLAGGEFITPDDSASLLKQGDILGVVMLYFNRERKLQARQVLPWTYLEVTRRERADVACRTISAFRNPIPRSRRRVEVMAYRIKPLYENTKARVMIRDNPNHPFRLTKVFLSPWEAAQVSSGEVSEKRTIPHAMLTTTRSGTLQLSRKEIEKKLGAGLIKIEVMSDEAVVARVPWLTGSTAELEITVPDDSARIEARLRLRQLETELLRVTAKRATIIAALKQLADNPRELDPTMLFKEIKKLPSRKYFQKQITLIRVAATEELNRKRNRTAARDVRKLCEKTESIVNRHLSDEPIDELKLRLGYEEKKEDSKAASSPAQ